ncbi:MAG: hypothetical protein FWC97_06895, partial [Treponema sp.]|nr:hypothetical protein [Treponema sp.]
IEGQQIHLNENTLIRIQRAPDGLGLQIDLAEGSIDVSTTEDGVNLQLSLIGQVVEAAGNSTINVISTNDHVIVHINEGAAQIITESGENTEIYSGSVVTIDSEGAELRQIPAVVSQPRPNARFLKSTQELLPVNFEWNRTTLTFNDLFDIQIAEDRDFTRIVQTLNGLTNTAQVLMDTGLWHWRLSSQDEEIFSGRFTVVESMGPELLFPIRDSTFRYQYELPSVRFNWSEVEYASYYFLEASLLPDFRNIQVGIETTATSFIQPGMGQGTWHWRVMPIFSAAFDGSASHSAISQFHIERHIDEAFEQAVLAEEQTIVLLEPPPPSTSPLLEPTTLASTPTPVQEITTPANRLPITGTRIGIERLRVQQYIDFSWNAVPGANAYIFTLFEQTGTARRQIIRSQHENRTSFRLDNLSVLSNGIFVWQVEAVSIGHNGSIDQLSSPGENILVIDIPLPQVQAIRPGVLYGR